MPRDVIADTGLLYALFDGDDKHHARAADVVRGRRFAFLTSLAVVTETMHMLKRCPVPTRIEFLRWIRGGGAQVIDLVLEDFDRIGEVIEKYADLPADFADATLVAIAERLQISSVATFDSDFEVYRYRNRSRFRNVLR